ncbi:hypothetical protein LQZ19_05930 [Treponema primitia]|uniref:hypothetical protein n=1 Tax=Treponema primitia TaxID=88058 RepID=UPI00397EFDC2
MLRKFYLALVLVFPCQFDRVHCCPYFATVKAHTLPGPALSTFGNYYTAKRYFRHKKSAQKWAAFMVRTYTKGPRENPLLTGGQLALF